MESATVRGAAAGNAGCRAAFGAVTAASRASGPHYAGLQTARISIIV